VVAEDVRDHLTPYVTFELLTLDYDRLQQTAGQAFDAYWRKRGVVVTDENWHAYRRARAAFARLELEKARAQRKKASQLTTTTRRRREARVVPSPAAAKVLQGRGVDPDTGKVVTGTVLMDHVEKAFRLQRQLAKSATPLSVDVDRESSTRRPREHRAAAASRGGDSGDSDRSSDDDSDDEPPGVTLGGGGRCEPCAIVALPLEGDAVAYVFSDTYEDERRMCVDLDARGDLLGALALALDELLIELHERHGESA
jgi:hypothetical protein